jgi:hypothetical protein
VSSESGNSLFHCLCIYCDADKKFNHVPLIAMFSLSTEGAHTFFNTFTLLWMRNLHILE